MPIIWITILFFGGVLTADRLAWSLSRWSWMGLGTCLAIAALFLFCDLILRKPVRFPRGFSLALTAAFFLGGIRYQAALPQFEDPAYILNFADQDTPVFITGLVVDFPDARDQIINLRIKAELLENPREGSVSVVDGLILAKIPVENSVSYGDRVKLSGYLKIPPAEEDFDYQVYLKRQSIYAYLPKADITVLEPEIGGNILLRGIFQMRTRALARIYQLWPDPEASLLAGILLGVESGIADQVQKAFRETGTTHIIAISGFNITIVAGLFSRFFSRLLNPRQGALAAVIGIGLYTLLVGADAAVVRAAVMGTLSLIARQIGRRQHGLNAAALASLIMILFNPQLPWDISFQLSLAATLGLILYADPLANWFLGISSRILPLDQAQMLVEPISEYVLMTFAAQLTTLPVMLYHFHSFSLNTFLTNPAILPVQPPIMLAGGLALLLSLIWFPLGKAAAPLVYPFVLFTIRVVEGFSSLPIRPNQTGPLGLGWVIGFYFLLGLVTFGGSILTYFSTVINTSAAAGGLVLLAIIIWRLVFSAPDGLFHFILFDVGTGSAIYLQSPSGQRIIINGGPSTRLLSDHLGRLLPPFRRGVDYWVMASPTQQDLDALAGNMLRFRPEQVLWLGDSSLCWESENLRLLLEEEQIPVIYGKTGQVLVLGEGAQVKVLSLSRTGGTLLVEYGSFRVLVPFGLQEKTREDWRMGLDLGRVTALLLADNGYQSSNPSIWINNLHPRLVLLSVGMQDNRGLPDRGLIDRLAGYSLLRTDQQGSIHLLTDGEKLWVQVDRLP
jgi:competence protein ComEC